MLPFTLTAADVATIYLKRSAKTFANLRPALYAAGFPRPIDFGCSSDPIWLRQEVEAWLVSRPKLKMCQITGDTPAEAGAEPVKRGRGRPRKQ